MELVNCMTQMLSDMLEDEVIRERLEELGYLIIYDGAQPVGFTLGPVEMVQLDQGEIEY